MLMQKKLVRPSDPGTSKSAAKAITPHIKDKQAAVLKVLRSKPFGMTDHELVEECKERFGWESGSTARTRRSELVELGLVYDSGHKVKRRSHRPSVVWRARHEGC